MVYWQKWQTNVKTSASSFPLLVIVDFPRFFIVDFPLKIFENIVIGHIPFLLYRTFSFIVHFHGTPFKFFLFVIITIKHAILSVKYALFCPQGALLPICIFSPFKSRRWSCCCCTLMQLVVLRHLPYYIMMNRICR